MAKRALLVVDIQNDYFPGGLWPLVGAEAAADQAAKLIAAFRKAKDPVVYIQHVSTPNSPFFRPGTEGAEINKKVAPLAGEPIVVKHYPNSFRETELKKILDEHEIEEVVICGSMSHVCIDATTRAAADLGYTVTLIHDACASRDLEFDGTQVPAQQVHAAFMAPLAFYARVIAAEGYLSEK